MSEEMSGTCWENCLSELAPEFEHYEKIPIMYERRKIWWEHKSPRGRFMIAYIICNVVTSQPSKHVGKYDPFSCHV